MQSDFEIGRVVGVDTAHVTIELNRDLKGLTRSTYEGAQEIGRINSYVIVPVGARRLVAMVTRVFLTEEAELNADRTMVTLPSARRLVKATLIGTLDGKSYSQGVAVFPVLDNPVHLVTREDLNVIFDCQPTESTSCQTVDPNRDPGFCVPLGDSPIFEGFQIQINPDSFFGKHAAILGSTGSGKSCTIASLLQSILSLPEVKQTHFLILDTNGEYRSAFGIHDRSKVGQDILEQHCLYIPSDPKNHERLVIPYWFMNSEDFIRLFRAKEGLQSPVLLRALRLSRSKHLPHQGVSTLIEVLRSACSQLLAITNNDSPSQQWAIPKNIQSWCEDALKYRSVFSNNLAQLDELLGGGFFESFEAMVVSIQTIIQGLYDSRSKNFKSLGPTTLQQIRNAIDPITNRLNTATANIPFGIPNVSADQASYFDRASFLKENLEISMKEEAESGSPGRIREACGPMFLRIRRFFEDPRFSFLFGPFPEASHVLAAFIRDVLGLPPGGIYDIPFSSETVVPDQSLPFYGRQRTFKNGHNVVILDLSLLASEVLENVTALIGRLVLELLQRLGEYGGEKARGSLPVVLVLEEAQNYIRESRSGEEESISRIVFERIAREGRKFGLSLVVASQRPSELSKTVLSQCSSFIVHRLQNPEDLRYFKEIVPGIYDQFLNQLPALSPQTALVLGECVRAPALVRIREANPIPRSRDPKFYSYWIAKEREKVPVEEVCETWEGKRE